MESDVAFNHGLLRIARQMRGFSQADLADKSGVSQGNISKLEGGLIKPTSEILKQLADALRFPTSLFNEPDRVYGLPLSVHPGMMYRKKASTSQRELDRLEAELNLRLLHVRRLLKGAIFENDLPLPKLDVDEYGGPEKIAETVRRLWLIPSGPIPNLMEYVERAGCIVFSCDFDDIAVDGVTVHSAAAPPCIFLNCNMPGDRQRFTLAHELGHIVMHRLPSPEMEAEANAFASALLMPANDIRTNFYGHFTIQKLASLKPVWKVSMQALLMRAKNVEAISDNQSSYLWRQISALGYRRQEPAELEIAPETPSVVSDMMRVHLQDLKYEVKDLCDILHVYEDDLRRMLPINARTAGALLRVIK